MTKGMSPRLKTALLFTALFTAIGLLFFTSTYLNDLARQHYGTAPERMLEEMTGAYTALVLVPFVLWIARRFPVRADTWRTAIAILFLGGVAYSVAHTTLMAISRTIISPLVGLGSYDYGIMVYRYPMEGSKDVIFFAIMIGFVAFFDRLRVARAAEVTAADLHTKLAEAKLENLRLQLHPHFLFNTLNAISSVMYEDVHKADAMLTKLSDFMRRVLASGGVHEVSLDEELDVERMYVEIMHTRLERNLSVAIHVADDARDAVVPFMLLQPLLENSIRHGMGSGRAAIDIGIDVSRANGSTVIEVVDNGMGIPESGIVARGHGLANVESRLQHMYGQDCTFAIGARPEGGTRVRLVFPFATGGAA